MDILISILLVIIGLIGGFVFTTVFNSLRENNVNKRIEALMEKAKKDAEKAKRDSILETKEEIHKLKLDYDKELKEKKVELKESEDRLIQREHNMDKRDELYQKRESNLDERENKLFEKQKEIQDEQVKVEEIKQQQLDLLQEISGIGRDKAKEMVMTKVKEAMAMEIASYIKESENEAKLEVDRKAKDLLVSSMQKFAADVANEQTITVVNLPNDDLKGRIIGREGRNIRTLEAITGVDLIIDDTPEAVVLSSFDPLRREIARVTLETLLKDGRIHPTRIEELYDKVCKDMKNKIMEYGNNALFELGLTKVDPELVEIIGKLHFRTSYGQNALQHSIEVAQLSGIIAGELGENVTLARRAGLLHDIGKIGIPDTIINKPGKLTDEEYNVIKEHPLTGAKILSEIQSVPDLIYGAKYHHERYDGKGYPCGIKEEKLPEIAAIIAVADAYDAMTSNRSYRKLLPQEVVRGEIEKGIGTQFHPKWGKIMLDLIDKDKEYKMHQ